MKGISSSLHCPFTGHLLWLRQRFSNRPRQPGPPPVALILPLLAPAVLVGVLLVMVLAAADITTTHLLHPTTGRPSLPLAIFTVMANSPEGLVASLCLIYLFGVVLLMAVASQLSRWLRRRTS